uniref:Uncharacterized protein n=1 Tax=Minutocellus polymorphus TaxID=265543 RepID=A0A7S0ARI3_9STRA
MMPAHVRQSGNNQPLLRRLLSRRCCFLQCHQVTQNIQSACAIVLDRRKIGIPISVQYIAWVCNERFLDLEASTAVGATVQKTKHYYNLSRQRLLYQWLSSCFMEHTTSAGHATIGIRTE